MCLEDDVASVPPADQLLKKRSDWAYLFILGTVVLTYAIWIGSKWFYNDWYEDRWKYLAKVGSMGTTMLFCWSFILVVRTRLLERVIGGLDKAYHVHSTIGKIAFGLIFLHPIFLAAHRLPDLPAFLSYMWFSGDFVRNSGIVALLGFALLVALTLWVSLKRHVWKISHNFFGALMLLVVVHLVAANAEIVRFPVLRAWMFFWIALAAASYVYIRFLYRFFGPLYHYRLVDLRERGDVVELEFESIGRRMRHRPGQYVWIDLLTERLLDEPHPFSISSGSDSPRLRFSVKKLGDWTSRLPQVPVGTVARVWGPYGVFGRPVLEEPNREAVLIGGGIGITPFIGMVEDGTVAEKRRAPVHLFYSVENETEAYYADELRHVGERAAHVEVHVHPSDERGFITADHVREEVGPLEDKLFLLCGPGPMMESLKEQLMDAGVSRDQIHTEDFGAL